MQGAVAEKERDPGTRRYRRGSGEEGMNTSMRWEGALAYSEREGTGRIIVRIFSWVVQRFPVIRRRNSKKKGRVRFGERLHFGVGVVCGAWQKYLRQDPRAIALST
eukprot:755772-Hanusia_phi.AAC.7